MAARTATSKTTKKSTTTTSHSAAGARRRANGKTNARKPVASSRSKGSGNGQPRQAPAENAISMLQRDHDLVRKLLSELESSKSADRQESLLERIEAELKMHTQVEEKIFYPAFRDAARKEDDCELYFEALEEHHAVDVILPEVKAAETGTPKFAARAKVLKELVEHHADEEESEMFPRARKLMDDKLLRELGQQIAEEKKSADGGVIEKMASFLGIN